MAVTKKQLNWTSVGYTPSGGSSLDLGPGVQSVKIDGGAEFIMRSGDADRYNTLIINHFNSPKVTVTTDNQIALLGVTGRGTITATHKDAKLAVGGSIVYTMIGAVPGSPDLGGGHKAVDVGTIVFNGESADGVTSPLSFALV